MRRKIGLLITMLALAAILCTTAFAHTPLFTCWDNGDGTFSCEAGFSDGSSAANMPVYVFGANGEVVAEGKIGKNGEATFNKPQGAFSVKFDGGPGHDLTVNGADIK